MDVDGLGLTPSEFAAVLAPLASRIEADEYSIGGEVDELEKLFARLLGKERAVFLPTGTLANHLALRRLTRGRGARVLLQDVSHVYNDSGDCSQRLSGLNLVPLAPGKATFTRADVERALDRAASSRVSAPVGAISIESPVRRLHGETFDVEEMRAISALARERRIGLHLDGARLFVASAYSGIAPSDYAALCDTVYVSLWKSFSSGSGAILAGPRELLDDLFQERRMFGGALFSAWPFAAVARRNADGALERLKAGVAASEAFLSAIARDPVFSVSRVRNGTSRFQVAPVGVAPAAFRERLLSRGVRLPEAGPDGFWPTVNETWTRMPVDEMVRAFREAAKG
jgi:threonine aldolase